MAANMTVFLNAREAVDTMEDIGIGQAEVQCFNDLFVRVLTDPRFLPQKRQFLLGLQSAAAAHKGFNTGVIAADELCDSFFSLTDALHRIRRAHPQLKLGERKSGIANLIKQIESCLKWA